ncbi:MAG TPA: element excision factor XisH family protein [Caldilineaceae bacterium]|nr:element excision factor XisH family protein [Caldilineaceae bacterium]
MPQVDLYHHQVRTALIKDGWTITHDPYVLEFKGRRVYADLGAEKPLAAEKDNLKIVVEIKVFGTPSLMTELEKALGQYGIYRTFLRRTSPDRKLYLAIPVDIHQSFFQEGAIQEIVADYALNLLVFDAETEVVVEWITN